MYVSLRHSSKLHIKLKLLPFSEHSLSTLERQADCCCLGNWLLFIVRVIGTTQRQCVQNAVNLNVIACNVIHVVSSGL